MAILAILLAVPNEMFLLSLPSNILIALIHISCVLESEQSEETGNKTVNKKISF